MLISFTVQNFGSIYEPITVDLARKRPTKAELKKKENILPVFGIFGANASGKSTLLQAFAFLRDCVVGAVGVQNKGDKIPYNPFAFSDTAAQNPSVFTVEFVADGVLYEYELACDATHIVHEHLYSWPNNRETRIFCRDGQEFTFTEATREKQKPLAERTLENRPYLYTSNEWNLSLTEAAFLWFKETPFIDLEGQGWPRGVFEDLEDPIQKEKILRELKFADLGILDIINQPNKELSIPIEEIRPELRSVMGLPAGKEEKGTVVFGSVDSQTVHRIGGKTFYLDLDKESTGTGKYLLLIGGVLRALEEGHVIIADELESSLHPLLACHIVELFQDPERNTGGGQLIFVSHNTTLLDLELLERCQIGLIEKDPDSGATDLYTLEDIKGVRNNENIAKGYLQGRYGAIPFLT